MVRREGWMLSGVGTAVAAAFLLTLGACGGDNNGNGGAPTNTPAVAATSTPAPVATNTSSANPTDTMGAGTTTPTPTETPESNLETPTPGDGQLTDIEQVRFIAASIIPSLSDLAGFAAMAGGTGVVAGPLPPGGIGAIPVPCPGGGSLSFSCTDGAGASTTAIDFSQCVIESPGVLRSEIDGHYEIQSPAACFVGSAPAGSTIEISFNGSVSIDDLVSGDSLDVSEDVVVTVINEANGTLRLTIDGSATHDCVGTVRITTPETLVFPSGSECATAGLIRTVLSTGAATVRATASGGLQVDIGDDGSIDQSFDSCQDPTPPVCA